MYPVQSVSSPQRLSSLYSPVSSEESGSESDDEIFFRSAGSKDFRLLNGEGGIIPEGSSTEDEPIILSPREPKRKDEEISSPHSQVTLGPLSAFSSDDESVDFGDDSRQSSFHVPDDDTIRIKARRLPSERVAIYNDLGGGFRKDAVVDDNLQQKVGDAFVALKALVSRGDQKVQIDIDNKIVWLRNADGTGASTKNLDELMEADAEVKLYAKKLIKLAKEVWPNTTKAPVIDPGYKAPRTASAIAPSSVTSQIKNDYSTCALVAMQLYSKKVTDPAEQDKALRRITAAESIITQMQKTIDAELTQERLNEAAATEGSRQKLGAQAAIASLEKYSNVNRLGLYVAVAFASNDTNPLRALALADQAAKNVQEVLQDHLDKEHSDMVNKDVWDSTPEWFPGRGTPLPVPKDEAYAKYSAALVYSMLPAEVARKGAANYWVRERSVSYKDGIEDDLVRFVVGKESASTAAIKTPMLDGMFKVVESQVPGFGFTLEGLKSGAVAILANTVQLVATEMGKKVEEMNDRHGF